MAAPRFASFGEFYPFYLSEHANVVSRRLHFIGSSLVLGCLLAAITTGNAWWLLGAPLCGYGFAWVGHFLDRKSTRLNSSHPSISYAVFCLKKKNICCDG